MKKTLRLFFVAVLAMIGMNASAQEVTLDFSSNDDWGFPTAYDKTEKSYTNSNIGVTVTINAPGTGHKINTTDKYLIFGKNNSTLSLSAFSFDVEQIKVYGRSGASGKVTQNIFVGETAVSTETTGATGTNSYKIDEGYQAAGNIYVLKLTNDNNTQITKIEIYKKGSGAKESAGLSWGTGSKTVTIDADDNVFPTLTNPHNLPVTFGSTKEDVATINSEGTITLVSAGSTVISAEFAGDDTYEAAKVTYTLTVKPAPVMKEYKIASTVESGKNYLIVAIVGSDYKVAKRITGSYGNLTVSTATNNEGVISFDAENAFTFTSTADGWTIQQSDGKYLYQQGTYNNFNVSATPADDAAKYFDIVADDDGFKVTNKQMNKYIQYVPGSSNFGCFAEAQTDAILPLFYVEQAGTGINDVKVVPADQENAPVFNLAGQKVNANYKGVVIKGGKKMIVK